jgi:apolipoprotein N-acyltransferase
LAVLSILLLWIFSLSYGVNHLPKAPTPLVSDVHFRLVQPNIAQTLKWQPEVRERTLENLLSLSARPGWQKITHIVWPEAAIPYVVHPDDGLVRMLKETLPPSVSLITGAMRGDRFPENPEKIWNSLFVIRPQIGVDKFYDKHHLVPFGEFIPLRSFVPIKKLTFGDSDFSRGAGPENISIAGIGYISPLICFEVIFPENIVARQKARPQLLLNLTNDGWFAGSLQPYQHFAMARMRAVEQGLPLLRLSNIGISAMIDPYGRIVAKLPLNYAGVLDVDLPKADASATIFSVIGRAFALILIYFFGCFVIVIGVAKRQIVS